MNFNTAIFYDLENLLKGYSFSKQLVAKLSLGEILEAVKLTEHAGDIAVQRAYANWSDPRLATMRGEINELGIDPIQVFGFSWDQKKNAADIQLAIDAIDLAHVRPALEVFVIVSGDGGFSSLAKKLHEYGKTVIGCAYRHSTNKAFQTVCDEFVWIFDPEETAAADGAKPASNKSSKHTVTDRRNVRLAAVVQKVSENSPQKVFEKVREILNWYAGDSNARGDLKREGIYLNVVQEAVKYAVPGFRSFRFGFMKFVEYLQYACNGTDLCVTRPPHSQAMLALRGSVRSGVAILPDLDHRDVHSAASYRSILASGGPVLRLPEAGILEKVARWLMQNPPEREPLGEMIDNMASELDGEVGPNSIKSAVQSLTAADVFDREQTTADQLLTLHGDIQDDSSMMAMLRKVAEAKLSLTLGEIEQQVLNELLPNAKSESTSEANV